MMITIGLDDTDIVDSPGTNKIAKAIVEDLADRFECVLILRHQLLDDPRVPYTSKNGSASVWLKPIGKEEQSATEETLCDVLFDEFQAGLKKHFVLGSDPGLCVAAKVPQALTEFGLLCQRELVTQDAARQLAKEHGIRLKGLGGTEGGVIGALAAVGLAAGRNDGRIVKLGTWPDDLSGPHPVEMVLSRDVLLWDLEKETPIRNGIIDVGKHLRPNYRNGKALLFARSASNGVEDKIADWEAVRFT